MLASNVYQFALSPAFSITLRVKSFGSWPYWRQSLHSSVSSFWLLQNETIYEEILPVAADFPELADDEFFMGGKLDQYVESAGVAILEQYRAISR